MFLLLLLSDIRPITPNSDIEGAGGVPEMHLFALQVALPVTAVVIALLLTLIIAFTVACIIWWVSRLQMVTHKYTVYTVCTACNCTAYTIFKCICLQVVVQCVLCALIQTVQHNVSTTCTVCIPLVCLCVWAFVVMHLYAFCTHPLSHVTSHHLSAPVFIQYCLYCVITDVG